MKDSGSQAFPDRQVKPFALSRVPDFPVSADDLVAESPERVQNHADVLGAMLFQSRDDILATFRALAEDPAYRAKLGALKAKEFEDLGKLSPTDQATALSIAELAMNRLIESFAGHLSVGARAFPGNHCIEYSIDSIVLAITAANESGVKLKKLATCRISEDSSSKLAGSFGRWLRVFGPRGRHG